MLEYFQLVPWEQTAVSWTIEQNVCKLIPPLWNPATLHPTLYKTYQQWRAYVVSAGKNILWVIAWLMFSIVTATGHVITLSFEEVCCAQSVKFLRFILLDISILSGLTYAMFRILKSGCWEHITVYKRCNLKTLIQEPFSKFTSMPCKYPLQIVYTGIVVMAMGASCTGVRDELAVYLCCLLRRYEW